MNGNVAGDEPKEAEQSCELFEAQRKDRRVPSLFHERTSATFNVPGMPSLKKLVSEALKEIQIDFKVDFKVNFKTLNVFFKP